VSRLVSSLKNYAALQEAFDLTPLPPLRPVSLFDEWEQSGEGVGV
jgi:hypothetical protein